MTTEYPGIIYHLRDIKGEHRVLSDCGKGIHDVGARRKVNAAEQAMSTCFSPSTAGKSGVFEGGSIETSKYLYE